jgi:hypothetical protein
LLTGEDDMEITLAAVTLGIALLVGVLSLLLPALLLPPSPSGRPKIAGNLTFGLLVILLFFFLALLKVAPFSPGQRLGWGWLIGGLTGLLLAGFSARMTSPEGEYYPFRSGFTAAGVIAALALTLLLFKGDPGDALLGCALGIAVIAGIFRAFTAVSEASFVTSLEAGGFLAITLAAGTRLAIYHFASREARGWWVYLLALSALWLLAQAIAYILPLLYKGKRSSFLALCSSAGLSIILTLVLGWLLALRLEPSPAMPQFYYLLLVGLGTALLLLWLSFERPQENPAAFQSSALAALLVIFLVVMTFKLQAGFGAGVALTAAWGIGLAGLAWPRKQIKLPVAALAVGANFLLLRLFLEQTGTALEDIDLSFHYTLIGLLLGVLLPFVYCSLNLTPGRKRSLALGLLALASPLLLLALWGPDAVFGLLVGLFAAQALTLLLSPLAGIGVPWASWQAPLSLLTLGLALVATQTSWAFQQFYQLPRTEKIYLAAALALLVVIWAFIGSLIGLLKTRSRRAI